MVTNDDVGKVEPLVISAEGESAEYLKSKLDRRWREIAHRPGGDEFRG